MSRYIVKLTPQGKYFFGGDMIFNTGKETNDTQFESYIISSFKTPQQTSLMGMLRFLLLSNDDEAFDVRGNHIKSKDAASALIGKMSFKVNSDHTANCFGKIVGIGPCCLYDKKSGKYYFNMFDNLNADFSHVDKVTVNGHELEIPTIKGYSAKTRLSRKYVSNDGKPYVSDDNKSIFIEDERIGIRKNDKGKTEDDAFYKQINYRMKDSFCFAFEAETDGIDLMEYTSSIVKIGADDSSFLFEAEEQETGLPYMKAGSDTELVLLSDAYLENPMVQEGVLFAITTTRPFRFLSCENSDVAADYNVKYKSIRNKIRYDLYEAGSVFYFRDKASRNKFCEYVDCYKEFVQIGYNKYCETK